MLSTNKSKLNNMTALEILVYRVNCLSRNVVYVHFYKWHFSILSLAQWTFDSTAAKASMNYSSIVISTLSLLYLLTYYMFIPYLADMHLLSKLAMDAHLPVAVCAHSWFTCCESKPMLVLTVPCWHGGVWVHKNNHKQPNSIIIIMLNIVLLYVHSQ